MTITKNTHDIDDNNDVDTTTVAVQKMVTSVA